TGLSRFSYLRVIARSSTARRVDDEGPADARSAGKELGARYVMEGTLRQAGSKLRLAVQIVDTTTGAHLWAENYERDFRPEALFELQDDLVPRIVSTVADMNGALPRSLSEAVRGRAPEDLSPYEAVLRSFGYFERITADELSIARSGLESAVRKAPDHADAWAMLALLCVQDYAQGFGLQPDPLGSGAAAARRAVDAAPAHHLAWFGLAQALFFQKEFESFRNAAERAVALNPMDGNSMAFLGELLTYAGFEERGMELAGRAKQLNPNHPGWYWYADFYDAYRQGDDRGALRCALKVNMQAHLGAHFMRTAAYGQLGERKAAEKALGGLLTLKPDFPRVVRGMAANWWNPEYCERLIDGLRKAGMDIAEMPGPAPASSPDSKSGEVRARVDEGFWVAVLPFKHGGGNADLAALAEGLSEEVVAGLSRFSYLRVITSGLTQRYADQSPDLRDVGREMGARYVMSGNLRQSANRLRVAAQLVDAATGTQLWTETYERAFRPDAIFELQDDVVPRIVSTIADWYGALPHSMSEALQGKSSDQLSPYEAVLRGFSFYETGSVETHADARAALERAVQQAPGNADAWAMLSFIYGEEHRFGLNALPDPLGRALHAGRRAVDAAPSNHFAHAALAQALFFRKEFDAFRTAADRAIALNPMDGSTIEYMAHLIAFSGDWDRGYELAERGRELNPNYPGWYWAGLRMAGLDVPAAG
ncbi:MAG: hypothetical protein LC796_17435, partial [Acidobacteria bacterium]|nr:hypothetical protein [Acidobacteriota bacterium]